MVGGNVGIDKGKVLGEDMGTGSEDLVHRGEGEVVLHRVAGDVLSVDHWKLELA